VGLENLKKKLARDKKATETNPCRRTTMVIGKDNKPYIIIEKISREEWVEDVLNGRGNEPGDPSEGLGDPEGD
jgi:hypothetical protein